MDMEKKTIALIEDNKILSEAIGEAITAAGFNVITASNGEAGLKLVWEKNPDLVLLDVAMPVMDGFTALTKLKESSKSKGIPVIMLTVLSQESDIKEGDKRGASGYIVKSEHSTQQVVDEIKGFFAKQDEK